MMSWLVLCKTKILDLNLSFKNISGHSRIESKVQYSINPEIDDQLERMIQMLEDMLRDCMLDVGGLSDDYLHLVQFDL